MQLQSKATAGAVALILAGFVAHAQDRAQSPKAYVPALTPLVYVQPVVPDAAKGIPGTVRLLLTIDPAGDVAKMEVLTGPKPLQQPATDAIRRQKYRPVIREGRPVFAYTTAAVPFIVGGKVVPDVPDMAAERQASRRLSEIAASLPRSPAQVLADLEQDAGGGDEMRKFYALARMAKAALAADAFDKAASYANDLLSAAPQHRDDWNYGNAIHDGNVVLGLLALQKGNVKQAGQNLLEAGNTPGSPQLNSFGPDMSLAKALLERGERDTVLDYFSRCRTFWKMGKDRLDAWSGTVRNGGMPNFSFNANMGI